ncbi:hypothetical protein A2Z33_03580 [Candidatus Gottesmanbacteria bacterium RBG_16_52_11]|uniref:Uncharacterized protein n=1 Tax=Candidatus Gottesmanbacteria bacterium RBG_16_52_11 TaxID=1798374 RepID=A0A1F5YVG3_9BACT|nr:MAG: hypothetical protein A2Z33_03580 [Candidatus Gottesmanbacteria bacterium RBG_16_52_11]
MDVKLNLIVNKIENSKLKTVEKNLLYRQFVQGIQLIVWPILVKHMPKNILHTLADNPEHLTIESYTSLITRALEGGQAFTEIARNLDTYLVRTNAVLAQAHIV